jgi:MFS family permease
MAVLFLIVFVDLVGFGLVIPLLPFYVQRVGASPEVITLVLGLYSLAQFVAAPVWGRLSDKYGRKPILALTSIGLGLSYLLLGYADSLTLVVASRILGGAMAGNIGAAQAYVSDVTTAETRARGMGMIGAAFGLGFILGPTIGGVLGGRDLATANFVLPAVVAAGLSFVAGIGALAVLKESLPASRRGVAPDKAHRMGLGSAPPAFVTLVITGFLVITAWAQFETVFALWANRVLNFGPQQIGFVLAFVGVLSAAIQGGAIGPLTRRFGERRLVLAAFALLIAGYLLMWRADDLPTLLAAAAVLAAGSGVLNPSLTSLVSQAAADDRQGAALGIYQGATSLSRVVGPAFSGAVFAHFGTGAPFLLSGALVLPAVALVLRLGPVAQKG